MELNRFEKANVKRIFNATKSLRAKKTRVVRVINAKMKSSLIMKLWVGSSL